MSLIFLVSGYEKLMNWSQTEQSLIEKLAEWHNFASFSESFQSLLTFLIPWSSVLLIVGVVFEFLGSLMLLFGYHERIGATLLVLLLIPTTLLFHSFWFLEGSARELQVTMFLKNLAILGGLIVIAIHGTQSKGGDGTSLSSMHFS